MAESVSKARFNTAEHKRASTDDVTLQSTDKYERL
jgi:hypothetical protein